MAQQKSWKTTTAAIMIAVGALLTGVALMIDDDPLTNPDWAAIVGGMIAAIGTAVGLWKARDDDVSSEGRTAPKDTE